MNLNWIGTNNTSAKSNEICHFRVLYHGQDNTPYAGGVWLVVGHIKYTWPMSPPAVKFVNKIYHPNIDFETGIVSPCVLNNFWSPPYSTLFLFDKVLAELLVKPVLQDPVNPEAATLLCFDQCEYIRKVAFYVDLYAKDMGAVQQLHYETLPYA